VGELFPTRCAQCGRDHWGNANTLLRILHELGESAFAARGLTKNLQLIHAQRSGGKWFYRRHRVPRKKPVL